MHEHKRKQAIKTHKCSIKNQVQVFLPDLWDSSWCFEWDLIVWKKQKWLHPQWTLPILSFVSIFVFSSVIPSGLRLWSKVLSRSKYWPDSILRPKPHQSNAHDCFENHELDHVCSHGIDHAIAQRIHSDQNGIEYENPRLEKGSNIEYSNVWWVSLKKICKWRYFETKFFKMPSNFLTLFKNF